MLPMVFDSGGVSKVTLKTHRSSKGPKLLPLDPERESKFKTIKKLVKEAQKQKEADDEIKEYKKR